jgi:hypothetical protein
MEKSGFRVHGVRYQTRDVNRAVAFYTHHLGFELTHQQGSVFASVSCGGLNLCMANSKILSELAIRDAQASQRCECLAPSIRQFQRRHLDQKTPGTAASNMGSRLLA